MKDSDAIHSQSKLEIHTFGGLRIQFDNKGAIDLGSRKAEALLIYLIGTGRIQPREVLADLLWNDFSQNKAMNNLRVILSVLRKHVGKYVIINRDSAGFNPERKPWMDAVELSRVLGDLRGARSEALNLSHGEAERLADAVDLYQGEFLEGFSVRDARGFDDWVLMERERYNRHMGEALKWLSKWNLEQKAFPAALEMVTRWLKLDPVREEAHQEMMRILAHSGQKGAAIKQYEACLLVLDEELGLRPSQETMDLYESILDDRLTLPEKDATHFESSSLKPPFKGLQHFDVEDAELFFGREELTNILVSKIKNSAFLAVIGASGSGKSSLIRAGLIPSLGQYSGQDAKSRTLAGSKYWPVHLLTPTAQPLEALAASLTRDAESVTATATLIDDMTNDARSLHLYVRKLLARQRAERLLLVIDQFEELFTLCRDETERSAFIENLTKAADKSVSGPTIVVITLRADFYAHCAQYPGLRQLLETNQAYIGQMGFDELRLAIEGPSLREGYTLETGLVELLLSDIGAGEGTFAEPGSLPLLSHALLETWKRRQERLMTLEGYLESGGIRGAIAKTAERVFQQEFDQEQQEIARKIFLRLTELGEGTQDTRRRATFEELYSYTEKPGAIKTVIQRMAEARLISISEKSVEVAHEALIREWPQLQEWLDEDREGLKLHRQLTEAANGWLELERDPGALLRGVRLAQTGHWAINNIEELNPFEQEYLRASQRAEQARKDRRKSRIRRELALERRGRRTLIGALIVSIGLIIMAVFFALQFRQSAAAALRQNRVILARELVDASTDAQPADPELGLLLAIEAIQITNLEDGYTIPEAEEALYRAVSRFPLRWTFPEIGEKGLRVWALYNPQGTRILTAGGRALPVGGSLYNLKLWESNGNFIKQLEGDLGPLRGLNFSQDGSRILAGSSTLGAKLWDSDGIFIQTIETSLFSTYSFANFNSQGDRIVSGGGNNSIRIRDTEGTLITLLEGHTAHVTNAIFNQQGNLVLSAGFGDTANLWDVQSGEIIVSLGGYQNHVIDLGFNSEGTRMLTGSEDGIAMLWDMSGGLVTTFDEYACDPGNHCGEFSPDGRLILLAGENGTATLWDIDGNLVASLVGHNDAILWLSFNPQGTRIATASADGTAKLWNMSGELVATFSGHTDHVNSVSFAPEGDHLLTGSLDGTVRLWEIEEVLISELLGTSESIQIAAYHPDGTTILTARTDGTTQIWNPTGELLHNLSGHEGQVWSAGYSPDGSLIVTAGADGNARLWDDGGRLQVILEGHERPIRWAAFGPDGETIITASDDATSRLWSLDGSLIDVMEGHLGSIRMAVFNFDQSQIATVGHDGSVRLWNGKGTPIAVLKGHSSRVNTAAFSFDGQHLVTASRDGTARVWDLADMTESEEVGENTIILQGHSGWVNWATFSPDGKKIVTASSDGRARVWDLNGNSIAVLEGHTGGVNWAGFSPNGRYLASVGEDGSARLWSAEGRYLTSFESHTGPINTANFHPDSGQLLTASEDGSARVWHIWSDVEAMLTAAENRLTRSLTDEECRQYLHLEACP